MKPESAAKTSNANANDELPQTKASTPKKTKKKKITTDEELVISKAQLEPPLNRNPSDDIPKLWEAINEMKSLLLKSWTTNTGHDDNLEFLEFSEFLNSKIPSSELSLFALYQKTITRNFFPT